MPRIAPAANAGDDAMLALLRRAADLAERTLAFRHERQATIEALKRESAATQAEADSARGAVVQAEADMLRARADVEARRRALAQERAGDAPSAAQAVPIGGTTPAGSEPIVVTSPFAGKVISTLAVNGEYVTSSSDVLMLQGQDAPMVEAYVSPADAKYARVGRRATLHFFDGERVPAVVTGVAAQTARIPIERVGPLSPRSQAILVRMRPEHELPARYRIDVLPLDVRFETIWFWDK